MAKGMEGVEGVDYPVEDGVWRKMEACQVCGNWKEIGCCANTLDQMEDVIEGVRGRIRRAEKDLDSLKEEEGKLVAEAESLKKRIERNRRPESQICSTTIVDLGDPAVKLRFPLTIVLEHFADDDVLASWPEVECHGSGTTAAEAILHLKEDILDLYKNLLQKPDEELGKLPTAWKHVLKLAVMKMYELKLAITVSDDNVYRVFWDEYEKEFVGKCSAFPSLSWFAPSVEDALHGIRELVQKEEDDKNEDKVAAEVEDEEVEDEEAAEAVVLTELEEFEMFLKDAAAAAEAVFPPLTLNALVCKKEESK